MDIGVKYCGGCNPRYNRKNFVELLKETTGQKFEAADRSKEYDMLLVLCGCSSSCADISRYKVKNGHIIMVKSDADFEAVVNAIKGCE